ncbi:MAG: phosphoglucosamine mutase [Actinomycetota bacterium]
MSRKKLFGTDGVRGLVGVDLTADLALSLGRAAAFELGAGTERPTFVVGRDTRISGQMLEAALSAGILSAGGEVEVAGVIPTPGVAFLVLEMAAAAGAVISASHNPSQDNGIKFFGPDGSKLSDEIEERIEQSVTSGPPGPNRGRLGKLRTLEDAGSRYVQHALEALEGRRLEGLKIVLDCAHGAAFLTSPEAFRRAGADVMVMNAQPNGVNINEGCGSTYPEVVAAEVLRSGADLGLALDGDADRVIAVDEAGEVVDGDCMIAALAIELKEQKRLPHDLVVSTVMANLGFRLAMASNGIELVETPVGDRYVLEAMRARGAGIGGEQSGHIILSEFSTTGDGLLTGLRLAARMVSSGQKLSALASVVEKFPQVLLNVRIAEPGRLRLSPRIESEVQNERGRLGDAGRVLVRASGTEPLVRVMVEAKEHRDATETAGRLARLIAEELGEDRVAEY